MTRCVVHKLRTNVSQWPGRGRTRPDGATPVASSKPAGTRLHRRAPGRNALAVAARLTVRVRASGATASAGTGATSRLSPDCCGEVRAWRMPTPRLRPWSCPRSTGRWSSSTAGPPTTTTPGSPTLPDHPLWSDAAPAAIASTARRAPGTERVDTLIHALAVPTRRDILAVPVRDAHSGSEPGSACPMISKCSGADPSSRTDTSRGFDRASENARAGP